MATLKDVPAAPSPIRMAEVLAALSLATDLGAGKSMGHAMRACFLGMRLAREMQLSIAQQAELYYSFLLMHSGCTALSLALAPLIKGDELAAIADGTLRDDTNPLDMLAWMGRSVSPEAPWPRRALNLIQLALQSEEAEAAQRGACEVAARVAQRLGLPPGVQETVRHYLERWDGKGPHGLRGSTIPLGARLVQLALKVEAFHSVRGRQDLTTWVRQQKGTTFDPQAIDAFVAVAQRADLWETLAQAEVWETVLDLEPASPLRHMAEAKLEDVALAVADFVDLKTPSTLGHSRETARLAEGIARRMGLPETEVVTVRRAALVHDLGLVALPSHILRGPGPLSEADKEKLRLHPYYTERVLARVPALAQAAAIAGAHHERLDGTGYYRGLAGSAVPVGARILAVADDFQERCQAQRETREADPKAILAAMRPQAGTRFAPECVEALAQELGLAAARAPRARDWPMGLTGREVEVLRLAAQGLSNRAIAQRLVIAEKTVGHHLEHIYNKLGVSNRAAAVFAAAELELLT